MARVETIGDCTLYLGDCLEVMPTLGKVDAVVTDPPYGISVQTMRRGGIAEKWDSGILSEHINMAISSADNSIIFGGNYYELPASRCWLIWDKLISPGLNLAHAELAWTNLTHVGVRLRRHMWSGPFRMGMEPRSGHPTQKPVGVMEWCLGFLPDAQTILDPFMGSGTTGVACVKLGRKFIGIEIDEGYFDIACKRIEEAYRQPDFFVERPAPAEQLDMLEADE